MKHSRSEIRMMSQRARGIFTRDVPTAVSLQSAGLPALYLGNPMMDGIVLKKVSFGFSPLEPVIALLPGSREEAYANLERMLTVVKKMRQTMPSLQILIAKAPSLETSRVQRLCDQAMCPAVITEHFWDALKAAHGVLGLSGTANEQAIYVGKTVYCFEGTGPQSTKQRFEEQRKLLGGKLIFLEKAEPAEMAQKLVEGLKNSPKEPVFQVPEGRASELICRAILDTIKK